ncbi:MAG TPA: hypothetical protein VF590_10690 [Isosphaeraceae bacterium]|jgi:hypothetical protein
MFSEDMGNFLTRHLGVVPYIVLAFGLFLVPVLLLVALAYLLAHGRRGGRDGLLLGFGVAAWASLCWLVVPYCGGYPCLPGLAAVTLVFGMQPVDTLEEELLVHAVNFLLWPTVGWSVFRVRQVRGPGRTK